MAYTIVDVQKILRVAFDSREVINKVLASGAATKADISFVFPDTVYPELTDLVGFPVLHTSLVTDIGIFVRTVDLP